MILIFCVCFGSERILFPKRILEGYNSSVFIFFSSTVNQLGEIKTSTFSMTFRIIKMKDKVATVN